MTGLGSPCGACKFLRRKCVKGCVFAPYFCHEEGASHFAAIHKVFGASNVSKLLSHIPLKDRSEAAVTISYEAQARLHDPIYGCVSHIFALQQQVVSLQAQLAFLSEEASRRIVGRNSTEPESRLSPSHMDLAAAAAAVYGGSTVFMEGEEHNLQDSFFGGSHESQSYASMFSSLDANDLQSPVMGYMNH
ncbi:PREDICTED: LOB domain-containing protein 29 [Tarenaya hassleriana]|uniref:LOB domain-containing protein 29 n=1 Tax=Tarenaya hassleriana TaxID=28532 RepID=UPI00053C4E48|nr:PREDICTED: LOB domain-containing protein 29 [Tarenaya hassleriana]